MLLIKGGRVFDVVRSEAYIADILVKDGKIAAIGENLAAEGAEIFDQMIEEIREDTVRQVLSVVPRVQSTERVQVAKPTSAGFADGSTVARKPVTSTKVGRNDPCPCGSGKKYKKCCGINQAN